MGKGGGRGCGKGRGKGRGQAAGKEGFDENDGNLTTEQKEEIRKRVLRAIAAQKKEKLKEKKNSLIDSVNASGHQPLAQVDTVTEVKQPVIHLDPHDVNTNTLIDHSNLNNKIDKVEQVHADTNLSAIKHIPINNITEHVNTTSSSNNTNKGDSMDNINITETSTKYDKLHELDTIRKAENDEKIQDKINHLEQERIPKRTS